MPEGVESSESAGRAESSDPFTVALGPETTDPVGNGNGGEPGGDDGHGGTDGKDMDTDGDPVENGGGDGTA